LKSSRMIIFASALFLSIIGILTIYSSTYQKDTVGWQLIYRRQVFSVLVGIFFYLLISRLNYRRLWDATYFLYGAAIFLLFLVFVLGAVRLGAQRWLKVGMLNFQPSELTKIVLIIFLARYFSLKSKYNVSLLTSRLGIMRSFVLPFIFMAVPVGLIIEQPDLGSGILVFMIFIVIVYLAGIKLRYLLFLFLSIAVSMPVFWHLLRGYQKNRLLIFLNPEMDPLGAGYTVIQSKIAIGSGGFFGKGWLSGTQSQLHFLPESHTDFIFATFAEQWGLVGSLLLLSLYALIIVQGFKIALRTQDRFGRLLAFGISIMLAIQVFINIAMNLGLAPVVGIPLPLMSYGGSSLLVTFLSLGILANIDKTRSVF